MTAVTEATGATESRALRVVQWTTGRVGSEAVQGVLANPSLELVGAYAWSPDKVGRDVGALCGIDDVGIAATDDIDLLIALSPDCVIYSPYRPDFDHVVRILESGCNVVTTMYRLAGAGYGDEAQERILAAATRGGASLYAGGIYPGHIPMVALAATAVSRRIERITMLESVDLRTYANEEMFRSMGIDGDPHDPSVAVLVEDSCGSFRDQVVVLARALALPLDDVRFAAEFAVADEDLDFGFMTIRKGNVAAIRGTVSGWASGRSRIECRAVWKMGDSTTPNWPLEHGYVIDVEGDPSFRCRIEPGHNWTGALSTAMPLVNAIASVCAAPAGIVNHGTLPLVRGAHTLR